MTVPVTINTMRQSTLGTADTCLHRLQYLFDPNVPRKGSVIRTIGTGYHAGIAEYYFRRRQGTLRDGIHPTPQELTEFLAAAEAAFDEDLAEYELFDWRYQPRTYRQEEKIVDREEAIDIMSNALDTYFLERHYWPENYEVMAVEMHFELPYEGMPGWTRSGTMDLVVRDMNTGRLVGDDQKFTRKQWNKKKVEPSQPQAAWYVAAIAEWFDEPIENIDFVFSVLGYEQGFKRWEAPRTQRHVQATLERGKQVAKLIEQGGPFPPNPGSFLCSEAYCDFWMICPFGASLNDQ